MNSSNDTDRNTVIEEYVVLNDPNDVNDNYTPENRFNFCKIALKKHYFPKYGLKDYNISPEHYVITNPDVRNHIQTIINSGSCSKKEFIDILNSLNVNQIRYIGF